jgi:hypothetical protein
MGIKELLAKLKAVFAEMEQALAATDTTGRTIPAAGPATVPAAAKNHAAEETANFQAKTGACLRGIAGMKNLAEGAGVAFETVGGGIRAMQRNIANGGKDAVAAFGRLGTSMDDLSGKSPEEAMGFLADQINKVSDANEKAALAQIVFGRSGVEMLPMLAEGSAGLEAASKEAENFGTVFTRDTLTAALAADKAFDQLAQAFKGLTMAIGLQVIPIVKPLIESITNAIGTVRDWIDANQDALKCLFGLGLALAATGAACIALSLAITAYLSPVVVIVGALAGAFLGVGAAALAMTDTLGLTSTGFGNLFNSIRIDGTGLMTWWRSLCLWMMDKIDAALSFVEDRFRDLLQSATQGTSKISALIQLGYARATGNKQLQILSQQDLNRENSVGVVSSGVEARAAARAERAKENDAQIKAMFLRDPQDASTGVKLDTSRATEALKGIGKNIIDGVASALGSLPGAGFDPQKFADAVAAGQKTFGQKADTPLGPAKINAAKPDFSTTGTFSGAVGASIAGRGVFDQQLAVMKTVAANTEKMANKDGPSIGD